MDPRTTQEIEKDRHEQEVNAMLIAAEFGYKAMERGESIQLMRENLVKTFYGKGGK